MISGELFGFEVAALLFFVIFVRCSHCNSPPIVFLIPRVQDQAACIADVSFELMFFIEMIIAMKCSCCFVIICFFHSGSFAPHDPWNHDVLLVSFVPSSATRFLFESPHINQSFTAFVLVAGRFQCLEDLSYSPNSPCSGREMMDHSNGYGKVKMRMGMG